MLSKKTPPLAPPRGKKEEQKRRDLTGAVRTRETAVAAPALLSKRKETRKSASRPQSRAPRSHNGRSEHLCSVPPPLFHSLSSVFSFTAKPTSPNGVTTRGTAGFVQEHNCPDVRWCHENTRVSSSTRIGRKLGPVTLGRRSPRQRPLLRWTAPTPPRPGSACWWRRVAAGSCGTALRSWGQPLWARRRGSACS